MHTVGCYKLDDGESSPSNLFPVKSVFRQRKEGAGHWLVARRNATAKKQRELKERLSRRSVIGQLTVSDGTKPQDSGKLEAGGNVLDRHLLMVLHCVDSPSELCSVDISGQTIYSVKVDDLEEFDNVAYINASDNHLTLEAFNRFPILRELELSVNCLCNFSIKLGDFPYLEVLDLSYNKLISDDVLAIGLLPRLKVLHLTGNKLKTLPDDITAPHHGMSAQERRFCALQVLMLDDNCLSSPGVFTSLANLKRLHYLNLQGNYITEVPYLQQMGDIRDTKTVRKTHSEGSAQRTVALTDSDIKASEKPVEKADLPNSHLIQQEHQYSSDCHPPFPELQYLNLANNKIAEEEALLATALFPLLTKLVIHSNPLTTRRSGDPPLLTSFLQDRLGIQIKRKIDVPIKPHIMLPINPKRKIKTKIPKIPKQPLLLDASAGMLPLNHNTAIAEVGPKKMPFPPGRSPLQVSDSLPQRYTGQCEYREVPADGNILDTSDITCRDQSGAGSQDGKTFFMTQLDDEGAWNIESEVNNPNEGHSVPEQYRGYEMLLDVDPDPDMILPVGIQQTVRALEQALKNLCVYRDFRPNLNHLQQHDMKRKNKMSHLNSQMARLPEAKPRSVKGQLVEDFLVKMRDQKTTLEVPLGTVLKGKNISRQEYEEAVSLFKDVKKKYNVVYMKAVEQACQMESAGPEL